MIVETPLGVLRIALAIQQPEITMATRQEVVPIALVTLLGEIVMGTLQGGVLIVSVIQL